MQGVKYLLVLNKFTVCFSIAGPERRELKNVYIFVENLSVTYDGIGIGARSTETNAMTLT